MHTRPKSGTLRFSITRLSLHHPKALAVASLRLRPWPPSPLTLMGRDDGRLSPSGVDSWNCSLGRAKRPAPPSSPRGLESHAYSRAGSAPSWASGPCPPLRGRLGAPHAQRHGQNSDLGISMSHGFSRLCLGLSGQTLPDFFTFLQAPCPLNLSLCYKPLDIARPQPPAATPAPILLRPVAWEGSDCSGGPFLADALPASSSSHSPLSPQVLTNNKGHYASFKIPHSLSPNSVKPPPPLQQEPTKSLRGVQSSCVCPSKWLQSGLCSDFKIQETSAHTPSRPPRTDPKGAATPHPHPTLDPNTHWLSDLYSLNPDANPLNWPFRPHLPPHEAAHTVFSKEHYLI